jgi:hypothetical protein
VNLANPRRTFASLAGIVSLALTVSSGCQEDDPGVAAPTDQVYYPIGVQYVPGVSEADDVVLVLSSNFDQRYSSGTLTAFSVPRLLELAGTDPSSTDTIFREDFQSTAGSAILSQVRILSLAGELAYAPDPAGEPGRGWVFSAGRALNRVLMVRLEDGRLRCDNVRADGSALPSFDLTDCTEAHTVRTAFQDPFPLALVSSLGQAGLLAVGHLQSLDSSGSLVSRVGLVDVAAFEARLTSEAAGQTPEDPFEFLDVLNMEGSTGIAYVSPGALGGALGSLLVVARRDTQARGLRFGALAVETSTIPNAPTPFVLSDTGGLFLGPLTGAIESRGLIVSPDERRAYLSLRFTEAGSSFNGAIGVIDLEGSQVRLLSVFSVGDELTRPVIFERSGRRWLLLADGRQDRIWVLDASTDDLVLVGDVSGRLERMGEDGPFLARTLASPASIVLLPATSPTHALVTNFGNSTLALIDVRSGDPRAFRLVARLGRTIDGLGNSETPAVGVTE